MKLRCSSFGLLGACVALLAASPAQAQTNLLYKFKVGDKLDYVLSQKMTMSMNVGGMDITVKMNQTSDLTWKITAVDKDGSAKITQTITRVRVSVENPLGGGKTEYDSKDPKEPADAFGKATIPIFEALAGAEFTLKMSPRGEASDVQLPKKILEAFKNGGPALGGMTPDALKQMASQGGLVLPKDAVIKGDSWQQKVDLKMDPVGNMVFDNKMTLQGETEKAGRKVTEISMKPTLSIKAAPDSLAKVTLKKQDNKGTAYFDNVKGQLVETGMEQNLEMAIDANGMTLTMNQKQVISMKLVTPK